VWVRAVKVDCIAGRNALAEVGLAVLVGPLRVADARCARTLNESTPRSIKFWSFDWYHLQASGLVKSTKAIPACYLLSVDSVQASSFKSYPKIILPDASVASFHEIVFVGTFVKKITLLRDVWVDPNAYLPHIRD
jgi:hypothetical protein